MGIINLTFNTLAWICHYGRMFKLARLWGGLQMIHVMSGIDKTFGYSLEFLL